MVAYPQVRRAETCPGLAVDAGYGDRGLVHSVDREGDRAGGVPDAAEIVAVNVTVMPGADGFGAAVSVVVVATGTVLTIGISAILLPSVSTNQMLLSGPLGNVRRPTVRSRDRKRKKRVAHGV